MTEHLPVTRYQPSNYVMCQLLPLTTVERRRRQQTKKLDTNGNVIVTRPATIRRRIIFKTAVLVYKCLHGMSPPYLSTYCKPTSSHGGRRHLRSAESGQLTVPRTKTNYGDRSFAVHGPVVWNSLPAELRLLDTSLPVFRKRLKIRDVNETDRETRKNFSVSSVEFLAVEKCNKQLDR